GPADGGAREGIHVIVGVHRHRSLTARGVAHGDRAVLHVHGGALVRMFTGDLVVGRFGDPAGVRGHGAAVLEQLLHVLERWRVLAAVVGGVLTGHRLHRVHWRAPVQGVPFGVLLQMHLIRALVDAEHRVAALLGVEPGTVLRSGLDDIGDLVAVLVIHGHAVHPVVD